jgi:hypothetical protein
VIPVKEENIGQGANKRIFFVMKRGASEVNVRNCILAPETRPFALGQPSLVPLCAHIDPRRPTSPPLRADIGEA